MDEDVSPGAGTNRRAFLRTAAIGVVGVGAGVYYWRLQSSTEAAAPGEPAARTPAPPAYGDWRDVYLKRWAWDKVVRSSHWVNCWYQAHCAWNVYVKDGLVWREEQAADYPQVRPDVPDFNPRGCQKGACFSERMYDGSRLQYPLKRVGERGAGRWERVSWEGALRDVAGSSGLAIWQTRAPSSAARLVLADSTSVLPGEAMVSPPSMRAITSLSRS